MSQSLRSHLIVSFLLIGLAGFSAPAMAAPAADVKGPDIKDLQESLAKQERLIQEQREQLDAREKEIAENRRRLEQLIALFDDKKKDEKKDKKIGKTKPADATLSLASEKISTDEELKSARGAGAPPPASTRTSITAPKKEVKRPEVSVLPDVGGVLTPKGTLMYEPSIEYINTTNNVFTFDGVQVAEVVFIGMTNATTAKRQVVQNAHRFRLGLTNRLEADVRLPVVYRRDTTTETNTTTSVTTRTSIEGGGFGDVDGGLSYQINEGRNGWPFLVTNLRYKANNAEGPFDVPYGDDNVAKRLPIGTGFHSAEGSLTAIKVTDPAILFVNLGYVHNIARDIDKAFGNTRVKEVTPGDAVNVSAGMGFSINPETSFTLGYKHSYVMPTEQLNQDITSSEFSTTKSDSASVGALMAGASYRLSPSISLNMNVEVGATREAPDVRVGFRVPIRLGSLF